MTIEQDNNEEIIYKRTSNFVRNGIPTELFITAVQGRRNYRPDIQKRDKLLLLNIKHGQKCPYCGKTSVFTNKVAFSFDDQVAMWRAVFDVKVLASEKERQIKKLKKMIKELSQTKVSDLFD
jgi:hypothetical protein